MAAWIIDEFGVKPEGLFAKWRYKRVWIDEFGNITNTGVPGKETMNLPSLLDYKKNDRRYVSSQVITEYCNLDTFKHYRVEARNVEPFADVQETINDPRCGYLEPLPEPFIPPNPFGTASYGLFAYINFCNSKNIAINIRIYKRNFVGDPIKIGNAGAVPVILRYKTKDDNKLEPIRSCEVHITLVADGSFSLEQFYTEDEREFKIQVLEDNKQRFLGFGTASDTSEEFRAYPYDVTLIATDGLDALKKIDYPLPLGSKIDIKQKFIEIICYCLAMTNLNLDIHTICNLYEVKMLNGLQDDPLAQASVNPLRANEKGKVYTCYQMLEKLCLQFGAFLVQDRGVWNFVRQSELANDILRKRLYNYKGLFLMGQQFANRRVATCNGIDISILDDSPILRIGNAYKRAEVIVDFGEQLFLIYNGDFELYSNGNFPGWTKYGGIKVSRIEKMIKASTGDIPSGNHALQFDAPVDNGKSIQTANIQVTQGDKITLTFNVGKTPGQVQLKARIILGPYYLVNRNGDSNYEWLPQLVACTININNPSDVTDAYKVSLEIPEVPYSGDMVIELFGFVVQGTYTPIYIDNLNIKRSTQNETTGRVLYVNQQDGFYTNKPDEVKLIFGDFTVNTTVARPQRITNGVLTEIKIDQYAIYTADGSYSTGWYEYGGSSAKPIPIGLALARSILKAYQQPFRFFEGSFIGDNISYLDIFNVNLPDNTDFNNRVFALISGDFDLTNREVKNANYVEIFNKPGKSVDMVIPGNDGDPFPPMPQNPNPPVVPLGRIFTEQFTEEFK